VTVNCYQCATPVPDNSRFCNTCGADLSGEHGREKTLEVDHDPELQRKLQAEVGGEYIIEKELGRGGMAIVYLGHDAHLGRKVAVKLLPPELTFGGSQVIERFRREARTAATLDHPHIIPVYRVSQGGRLFWYVMKFLDGEALDDILAREGQLAVERTVDIIAQTAGALDYAHKHQVIHRDIKPANIMVDAEGRATVTDFGIAKALDASTLTATGGIIGTPYYMSPEQCTGKRVGPASDQYALAVMTYQMLGGHLPFTGESVAEIVHKHVMEPVPPLGVLRPQLPPALVSVVERGLAKPAEIRFANCADFAKALGQAAQGLDITVAPPGQAPSGERMSKTALVSPIPGAVRTAKGAWRERRQLVIGGGLLVGAVALAVGMLIWRGGRQERPSLSSPPPPVAAPAAPAVPDSGRDTTSASNDSTARPTAVRAARLTLNGVPAGATVTRDGRAVRGNAMDLPAGRSHIVSVTKAGFITWADTLQPGEGEQLRRTVALVATAEPAAAASVGYISVGTRPRSTIYVNGQATPRNPLLNYQVPAGTVHLRFQVADSSGLWWALDRDVTVGRGDTVRLSYIQLVR
jgi:hypothetical protein